MIGLIRRYSRIATVLVLLCALALALSGFSGSPQTPADAFSGPTNVAASAADGTITVTWTPGNAAASQVIVVVNVLDDTDYCLEVDFTGTANSYQCAGRAEGETYVVLVIALDGEGGYELGQTTQPVGDPDLSVSTPIVAGDNLLLGTTFTMAVTVTNQGSGGSAATTLRYYSSTDATVTTSDTELGTDAVVGLAADATSDQTVELTSPTADGTYYYGACVDAVSGESDTANNCSKALVMTLGAPDLLVSTPSVSTDNPTVGASFTLSATVRNQGSLGAAAATLRYYRSADATITTSDTAMGTNSVSALAAFGSSAQSIDLTAPSQTGTYYYGACVDTVSGESSTANNCSDALVVTVVAPDLLVNTPTLEGDNPAIGASFTLQARVINQGGAGSGSTTVRFYRSADATITGSDTEVGTSSVSSVAAAGISTHSTTLTAPSDTGDYYYGACVVAVSGESDTANNCSGSVSITVTATTASPDLTVDAPTVSDSTPSEGGSFTLSATVRNRGDGRSAATTLRYYRSTDSTLTASDTAVGTDPVVALAASGASVETIDLTAPSDPGTYYYGACVDTVSGESDITNNCSGSVTVTVERTAPDLVVLGADVSPDSPEAGGTFRILVTVQNYSGGQAAATTVRFYRSTDATITTSDTEVGTEPVRALGPMQGRAASIALTAPSDPGTYYYGACVDAVSGESDTTNNCSPSAAITVGDEMEGSAPDLVVLRPDVSDSSPETGETVELLVTVTNQGDGRSEATTVRFYRSTDATITTSDEEWGAQPIPTLVTEQSGSRTLFLTDLSDSGTYYYGACVDAVSGESDTTNNCSVSVSITVNDG